MRSEANGSDPQRSIEAPPVGRVLARLRRAPRRLSMATWGVCTVYAASLVLTTGIRPEHMVVLFLIICALYFSDGSRRVLGGIFPIFLLAIFFDSSRLLQPLLKHLNLYVHVSEPYNFDKAVFGLGQGAARITPNEYFAEHHWPWIDLVTGTAYIIYLYVALGFGFYLAVFRRDDKGRRLLQNFGWALFLMNILGVATYYLYPAAPPWYVALKGLGPADLSTAPNGAAALRWDALTGIGYFEAFYKRSTSVFGAIPSLHAAYPLITFLYMRQLGKLWLSVTAFLFFLLVCFSAVYLQHHYILDLAVGLAYALIAYGVEVLVSRTWLPAGGGKAPDVATV